MPLAALAVPAIVGAASSAAGAGIAAATGVGKSEKTSSFTDPNYFNRRRSGYDPNAFELGGQAGFADAEAKRIQGMGQWALTRDPAQFDTGTIAQARDAQTGALGMYQDAAMGRGPSAAQAQLRMGLDQSLAAQASMAASARGGALARSGLQLAGVNNAAAMQGQAAGQAAMLRAQEQQAGMAGYANMANALRGVDQQQMMAQAQMEADQRARNDAYQQWAEASASGIRGQALAAAMQRQNTLQNAYQTTQQINAGIEQVNAGRDMQYFQAGVGGVQGALQGAFTGGK